MGTELLLVPGGRGGIHDQGVLLLRGAALLGHSNKGRCFSVGVFLILPSLLSRSWPWAPGACCGRRHGLLGRQDP